MANDKWQQVRKVFDDALRQKPEERARFVNVACGGDKTLFREVESLLSSHDSAESFMETPAVVEVADVMQTKKLEAGQGFGRYEIIKLLGEGGMGIVYLGRDSKLDRLVAIKVLNKRYERNEENVRRFVREAKAESALNHP